MGQVFGTIIVGRSAARKSGGEKPAIREHEPGGVRGHAPLVDYDGSPRYLHERERFLESTEFEDVSDRGSRSERFVRISKDHGVVQGSLLSLEIDDSTSWSV